MPDSFAQRHGLAGPPPGTLFREEVPTSFRVFLSNLPHADVGVEAHELSKVVCNVMQVWPDEHMPPFYEAQRYIKKCEWFRLYEMIEELYLVLYEKGGYAPYPSRFVKAINEAFVAQNIGWQLVNGRVVMRGDQIFEDTLQTARETLWEDAKPTAAEHLNNAIRALSTRPKPNTNGAVSHATCAVECVLGKIHGKAMTLGEHLKEEARRAPRLLHPSLNAGLDKIYGYACDVARHGKEATEPMGEDAEFVLSACAAICTLLTRKRGKVEVPIPVEDTPAE